MQKSYCGIQFQGAKLKRRKSAVRKDVSIAKTKEGRKTSAYNSRDKIAINRD